LPADTTALATGVQENKDLEDYLKDLQSEFYKIVMEEGDVDQKHQIFPPRSSFRIALARANAPIPKCPGTSAIKISISRFKRKVNISIDGFEQRALLHFHQGRIKLP
jgi:hypothetical protein